MAALGNLVFVALVIVLVFALQTKAQGDLCQDVSCPRGRMCVMNRNGGRAFTQCSCPDRCPSTRDPVCTVYNIEFPNRCEMHKFACANDIPIRVKNNGNCDRSDQNEFIRTYCPEGQLLQFPIRYLEWLMIARERSLNPNFRLIKRGDSLRDDERRSILRWEFDVVDRNKNTYFDSEERQRILDSLGAMEPCIYGFLQACDQKNQGRFGIRDWEGCFPMAGTSIGSKL